MSFLMAGGGMSMGQVIGATTAKGEEPKERRFHPGDVLATWYRFLGIDPAQSLPDRTGRAFTSCPECLALRRCSRGAP